MPGKKRIILIGIGLLLSFALLIAGCGQKSSAPNTTGTPGDAPAKAVELKMVGTYPLNAPEWTIPKQFVETVNKQLEGKVKITIAGGPELIPTTEVANAVRTGAMDISFSMAAQYVPLVPEADAFKLATLTPAEMRANGGYEFIDKLFNEKSNSHFLGFGIFGRQWFHFFSNEPLTMDLSGHIFRSVPIYDPLLKALGAKVTTLDMTEINTAMDRGVITAFNYPVAGADDNGFGQAAKYVTNQGFYSAEPIMAFNLDKWNQLPKDVQETIDKIAAESEMKSMTWCKEWEDASAKDLKEEFHLTFYDLSAADQDKLYKTAEEAGWEKIKERSPENWEKMKKFLTEK